MEDIVIMRGETVPLKIAVYSDKEMTEPVLLGDGEKIIFGIKKNPATNAYIFRKELTSADIADNNRYAFRIEPMDTRMLAYGEYFYDYGIQKAEDDYRPCTNTGKFIIVSSIGGVL